jgi:hypothetical protein
MYANRSRKIGVFHGRPMSVLRSDIDADLPRDIPEMPDEEGLIERMNVSIKLIHYLEDFMTEIQQLRKREKKDLPNIVSRLAELKTELTTWWAAIPDSTFNVDRVIDAPAFRSCMHLRLLYCLIRMFIGRPFLFTGGRYSEDSPSSPPEARKQRTHSTEGQEPPFIGHKHRESSMTSTVDGKKRPSRRLALVHETIDAAVEALDHCRTLYEAEGLARASYIEYSSCRASMLALIAYSIQEQTDQYRGIMQKGIEMVREMASAGDSARAESTLIEALERAVARLQMFSPGWQRRRIEVRSAPVQTKPPQPSNYEKFRHWQQTLKRGSDASDTAQLPAGSMGPPTSNWDQTQQQQSRHRQSMPLETMLDLPSTSPYAYSDASSTNPAATGYAIPAASNSSDPGMPDQTTQFFQQHLTDANQQAAAEAAFFQTLHGGMSDVTPSAAAVNGWLTQARPERQLLDHFLNMPEGDFESVALGWPRVSDMGQSQSGQGVGQDAIGGGNAGFGLNDTLWWDLPGTGNGNGGGAQLPGFGGW